MIKQNKCKPVIHNILTLQKNWNLVMKVRLYSINKDATEIECTIPSETYIDSRRFSRHRCSRKLLSKQKVTSFSTVNGRSKLKIPVARSYKSMTLCIQRSRTKPLRSSRNTFSTEHNNLKLTMKNKMTICCSGSYGWQKKQLKIATKLFFSHCLFQPSPLYRCLSFKYF